MGFLSDIRILDVTRGLAGPMATHVMSDYGADIIRIDVPGAQRSPADLVHLRGRRSIAIDLMQDEGQALLAKLAANSDVLLSEPTLDGVQPVRPSYAELAAINRRLIYCRLTAHGDEGALAEGWYDDRLIAARYGVHNQPGWRPGPTFIVAPIPSLGAALLAVQGIGAALFMREKTGRGQEVTTSLLAGALAYQPGFVSATSGPVMNYPGLVGRTPFGQAPFYSIYECGDGKYLHLGCLMPNFQQRALDALEVRTELEALGFGTPDANENFHEIVAIVGGKMKARPYAEWAALFEEKDIPFAPSQWTDNLLDDPQVAAEGLKIELSDPVIGPISQIQSTVMVDGQEWQKPSPAPSSGLHTDEICAELGMSPGDIAALRQRGVLA